MKRGLYRKELVFRSHDITSWQACAGVAWVVACIEDPEGIEKHLDHRDANVAEREALMRRLCRALPTGWRFDLPELPTTSKGCKASDAGPVTAGRIVGATANSAPANPSLG